MADLVTLARAQLGIPSATSSDDAWLEALIDAASAAIENWCGRHFVAAEYTESFDGRQDGVIVVRETPIQYIVRLAANPVVVAKTTSSLDGFGTTVGPAAVRVSTTGVSYRIEGLLGFTTVTYSYSTGTSYLLSGLKTQIEADVNYDWLFNIESGYESWASRYMMVQGPLPIISGSSAELRAFTEDVAPDDIDTDAGMVFLDVPPERRVGQIIYRAGYDTVPEDVQEACVQLVKMMFESGQVSSILHRERLGDYSYQIKDAATALVYSMPPSILGLLAPYRNRRVLA